MFYPVKEVFLDEVNAVETAHLRATLLPEPHRTEIQNFLREYMDVRLEAVRSGRVEEATRRSKELHDRLWSQAVALGETNSGPPARLSIESLNEVINLHTKRVTESLWSRIPGILWFVLYAITGVGIATLGYSSELSGTNRSLAALGG